ncbi:MAG TPA: MFS transporter [Clostridia bacterium]|nr:MFS transporter [Clostridia bacterium]
MDKKVHPLVLWGNFYAFIITGMAVLITGAILPYLIDEFHLSYSSGGLLLALQAIGNLGASLIGGIISDYVGRKTVMLFGSLCFLIGFGGVFFVTSTFLLFLLLFMAGIGWGVMNSMVNSVVSDASGGRSSTMNLLHMFFAIGAFIAPLFIGILVRANLSWRFGPLALSFMSAILFLVFLIMPIESTKKDENEDNKGGIPFSNIRYYIFMLLLFLYVGSENSINGWMVTYLQELNIFSTIGPQDVLSIFWVAIIAGRLLNAAIHRLLTKEVLILTYSLGGSISFILFLLTSHPVLIMLWVFLMGIFFAGFYPTLVANASSIIRGSGAAAGILMGCGGMGGAVVPYINGIVAEGRGLYAGLMVIVVSMLLLIIIALINYRQGKRDDAGDINNELS